jgi:hypothetical protein
MAARTVALLTVALVSLGASSCGTDRGVACSAFLKRHDLDPTLRTRVAADMKRDPNCHIRGAYSNKP